MIPIREGLGQHVVGFTARDLTGESKAKAIKAMVSGEITPQIPCSILNEHNDVVVMLDKAAASLLD